MSVGFDRFLRVVSGGKYSSNGLFNVRKQKVQDSLDAFDRAVTDLEAWHVAQADDLREEYQRALADFNAATQNMNPHGTAAQFRAACDKLRPVKREVRNNLARAEALRRKVEGIRQEPPSFSAQGPDPDGLNKEVARARDELKLCPTSVDKIYTHVAALQMRLDRLDSQADQFETFRGQGNLQGAELDAYQNAKRMANLLFDRVQNLTTLATNHPFTEAQIFKAKAVEVDAGIKLLDDVIQRLQNAGIAVPGALTTARADLDQRRQDLRRRDKSIRVKDPKRLLGPKKVDKKAKQKLAALLQNTPLNQLPLDSDKVNEEAVVRVVLERALQSLNNPQKATAQVQDLDARLSELHVRALNDQQWAPISKSLRYTKVDGTHLALQSDITPASSLGNVFADMNGTGVCSHDAKQYTHAVNLAATELKDANGTTLFAALRHGINSAYGITTSKVREMPDDELEAMVRELLPANKLEPGGTLQQRVTNTVARLKGNSKADKQFAAKRVRRMRQQANLNRAQEIVLAALVKNQTELTKAQNGQLATIAINSISLVTPAFRPGSEVNKEDIMLKEQMETWAELNRRQVITVPIRNPNFNGGIAPHPVTNPQNLNAQVAVKVIAFNFGVNVGAVGKAGLSKEGVLAAAGTAARAWKDSDRYNVDAMNELIGTPAERAASDNQLAGKVGDWLTQHPFVDDYGVVERLALQVADIWDSGEYKQAGNEPYKMVSRLAVLTHKIGAMPAFNCKSGKDRTGQLDVEAKLLATQVASYGGAVPTPNLAPSQREKANRLEMALNSGSLEMQQYNTGHMGFKLEGVSALDRSYASDQTPSGVEAFRGTSSYTKA